MRIFRTRSLLIFAMLALVILPMLQSQQVIAQDLKSQADQFIDVLEKNDEFTGIAFLAKGDEILYQRTGGMAVYEWDIPIGTDTRFCLASVSKQFTAAAILILEQDEKLKVEDSISNFFPDFPNGEQITIHQLLTHTSGIPNFTDFKEWMTENKVPLEVDSLVADLATREPDFKPGTAFKYSNSGYAMLGRIIELASGQSYDAFLKARIFEPLKMKDSGTFSGNPTVQNLAFGYAGGSKGYQPAELIDLSQGFGAGHIYSTVEDMYKWDRALTGKGILTEVSKTKMYTPIRQNYGYGWGIIDLDGVKAYAHSGGINGYATFFLRLPEEDVVAVVLCNSMSAKAAETAIALGKLAVGKTIDLPEVYTTIAVDQATLGQYVGKYQFQTQMVMTIERKADQLYAQLVGQPAFEVFPEADDTFFFKVVEAKLVFEVAEGENKANQVTLFQNGAELPFKRMEE